MANPKTWKGVVKHLQARPIEVQKYFEHCPKLVEEFPLDVGLAYVFSRIELAQNMALYCGAVKLHRANAGVTRSVVTSHHVTRDGFEILFTTIHGKALPKSVREKICGAERVRDKVMHGKGASESEIRRALVDVFDYAETLNDFVEQLSGFKPCDDLRGFKGRAQALDTATTRWLLKGLGFQVS